jgi:hypothetical protein
MLVEIESFGFNLAFKKRPGGIPWPFLKGRHFLAVLLVKNIMPLNGCFSLI